MNDQITIQQEGHLKMINPLGGTTELSLNLRFGTKGINHCKVESSAKLHEDHSSNTISGCTIWEKYR